MQTHKKQILFGGIVVLLVIALAYATRENDPVYQGKRLSEHLLRLQGLGISFGGGNFSPSEGPTGPSVMHSYDPATFEAIEAVGTNALPMLARMLGAKDSRFRLWLDKVATKHALLAKLGRTNLNHAFAHQASALVAFSRLGSRAASAVPDIIPLLDDPDCALPALVAIMYIRPDREKDILSLTNVLGTQAPSGSRAFPGTRQSAALLALSTFGAKASNAAPILIECLTSTHESIHSAAAVALARIGSAPEKVVPLIIANLPKTNPPPPIFPRPGGSMSNISQLTMSARTVQSSIWALGEYGRHASNALPILSNLEQHPLANVKQAARAAAAKIRADTNSVSR